jgi:hypothetical protein
MKHSYETNHKRRKKIVMKKIIDDAFLKYNLLSDVQQDEVWDAIGGPAANHLQDACETFSKQSGLTQLESLGIIVGSLMERSSELSPKLSMSDVAQPFMGDVYRLYFEWIVAESTRPSSIDGLIVKLQAGLDKGDRKVVKKTLESLQMKLFSSASVSQASAIYDKLIRMEAELFNTKPSADQFSNILLQAFVDHYNYPNDIKYLRIKDDTVILAKSHYALRDSKIEEIRLKAMKQSTGV